MVSGRRRRTWARTAGFYGLAALFMLPTVFVFYWMITLSVKPQVEATAYPPSFFRFSVTAAGYREVFTKYPFLLYTWNSLVVALGCTALGLAVGLPAAYSIARWRQRRLALTILVARIIPGISYLIPWYIFFRHLRLVDTHAALILTHLIVGLPIIIWVMIGFFEDVPPDLEDAALIDGCSYFGVFWRVALAAGAAGRGRDRDPVVRLLVEQLPLLGDPGRPPDADAPDRGLQHDLLRGDQLGHPGGRRHDDHAARAHPGADRPAPHRDGPHVRRRQAVGGKPMAERHAAFVGTVPANYDRYLGPLLFHRFADDLAARLPVSAGTRVLEVACGTGIVTERLVRRLGGHGTLVATDLNEPMLAHAQARIPGSPGLEWRQADGTSLPFPDRAFDAVVCQFGLMFFPDKAAGVREAYRVLRPAERTSSACGTPSSETPIARITHETIATFFPADPPQFYTVPFSLHDVAAMRRLLEAAGFAEIHSESVETVGESPTAEDAARGLVEGNPVVGAIMERRPEALAEIKAAVARNIAAELGDRPVRCRLRAHVFTARRPEA